MQGTAEFEQRTVAGRIDGGGRFDGSQAGMARVKTIRLGGRLEVRAGLRKIHFAAVVRNIGPQGGRGWNSCKGLSRKKHFAVVGYFEISPDF